MADMITKHIDTQNTITDDIGTPAALRLAHWPSPKLGVDVEIKGVLRKAQYN